jgi:hypothetical protein
MGTVSRPLARQISNLPVFSSSESRGIEEISFVFRTLVSLCRVPYARMTDLPVVR